VQVIGKANDFSNYTDSELFSELSRLANELGIKMTLTLEPSEGVAQGTAATHHERRMIESISYTETGKPNLKLVSKEYAHRELRRMLGGDAEQVAGKANDFSNYSDTELLSELSRLANELGIKLTLSIEPSDAAAPVIEPGVAAPKSSKAE
jgi:hypothetical protein